MGFLSKAWGGIKKAFKKVARAAKKVAKKVTHAMPGGKKLWSLGTKVGQGIMKGVGKIVKAIGPIGMIALSFVIGPMAGALWASFGAGAAAMAASANVLVSTLGTIGSGIFAAGNFIAGTLGAVGEAIIGGAKNVVAGEFGAAASTFASNMGAALTGEAGMAAVSAGASAAAASVGTISSSTTAATTSVPGAGALSQQPGLGQTIATDVNLGLVDPTATVAGVEGNALAGVTGDSLTSASVDPNVVANNMATRTDSDGLSLVNKASNEKSLLEKTMEGIDKAKSLLGSGGEVGGGQQIGAYNPITIPSLQSAHAGAPNQGGGVGSSGFSLLDGVEGLRASVLASQRQLFG